MAATLDGRTLGGSLNNYTSISITLILTRLIRAKHKPLLVYDTEIRGLFVDVRSVRTCREFL